MTPQDRFDALADELGTEPGVTLPGATGGTGFGAAALRVNNKIFAMLVQDRLVLKLPKPRVDALVSAGHGDRWDADKGRPMREWLTLSPTTDEPWTPLAHEALTFVAGGR
ncbi:hypothetical protein ACQEVZ_04950 [Dactylosporangium sp. CA-152071]|uniref:hypothetical protein n=1 Tax=Dactylosporangium sp. CA-152071 TaxID=3239933 RepID=UPI003D8B3598